MCLNVRFPCFLCCIEVRHGAFVELSKYLNQAIFGFQVSLSRRYVHFQLRQWIQAMEQEGEAFIRSLDQHLGCGEETRNVFFRE